MDSKNNTDPVHRLAYEGKDILLVGTAHVSKQSVELVQSVIDQEGPDTVCVELCAGRFQTLRQKDSWQQMDIVKVIREKKSFLLLSNLILAAFQKRIAAKLDIRPGQEMIQAIESAEAIGATVHLADRDVRVTLSRTWRQMGWWARIKLIFQLILSFGDVDDIGAEEVERLKQQDMLETILAEVGRSLPTIRKTLIDERDQYLAAKIRTAPGQKIVAVVGAGHVPGILKYWSQPLSIGELETLPPKGRLGSLFKWGIPAIIVALMAYGFFRGGSEVGAGMVMWWIGANGLLAGLGALAAWAHPMTILSSMLAAPLTSLNPMIAAGWVSGLVEAFSRKPQVKDFERLQEDIQSLRGFWSNKVTRILLVVAFTNLGSAAGTFVAFPMMMQLL
ncbi:TraB/GumN family protein [Desulfatitalea tepidiphila]|uniref:TraB/GumN family protein n=1 Tax=Desulfatitalea tepidiphila TaxID=1185843 RepID=UPI0006B6809B|nr:TraB/GumN family protein [Desulfatitalea tepidiphila]